MPVRPKELVGAVHGAGTSVLRRANEMDLFRQQPITPRRNSRTPLVGSGCACPEFLFARDHRRRPELPIEIEIGSTSIIPALIQDGEVLSRLRTLIPKSLRSHSHQLAQRSAAVPDPSTQVVGGEGSGTAAGGSAGDANWCGVGCGSSDINHLQKQNCQRNCQPNCREIRRTGGNFVGNSVGNSAGESSRSGRLPEDRRSGLEKSVPDGALIQIRASLVTGAWPSAPLPPPFLTQL